MSHIKLPHSTVSAWAEATRNFEFIEKNGLGEPSYRTVASASEIDVGTAPNSFIDITGTTNIDTITPWDVIDNGSEVTLYFAGSLTVNHLSGNIALAGAANFSATADDILVLVYKDGTWHEKSRTVK